MPTLELPNLAQINWAKQTTPAPIAIPPTGAPISQQSQAQTCPNPCSCQPGLSLSVEQGATLNSQIALVIKDANGVTQPVDITGFEFQFTAKTDPAIADSDPSVVKVDWTETTTAAQGTTWLTIPSNITAAMQPMPYFYQVRMVQSPSSPSPIVTPLFNGPLSVIQPISMRHQ